MDNQLIVYRPKSKAKEIILNILLWILIGISIFALTAGGSLLIFSNLKWNKTKNVDLKTTQITLDNNTSKK